MGKKALLVVSFGTSCREALKDIENIEKACGKALADYDFYRVFTSGMILRKLKKTGESTVYDLEEILGKLSEEGYGEILCQPTHIMDGVEYRKMLEILSGYQEQIPVIRTGSPLLTSREDYRETAQIVMNQLPAPLQEGEAFLLMGHGNPDIPVYTYTVLENMLRDLGYDRTFVGNVEGVFDIGYEVERLKMNRISKVTVMPLMVVAGKHAREDLAGEKENSWRSVLIREGFRTEILLKGLGSIDDIARMYVRHAREAVPISRTMRT